MYYFGATTTTTHVDSFVCCKTDFNYIKTIWEFILFFKINKNLSKSHVLQWFTLQNIANKT